LTEDSDALYLSHIQNTVSLIEATTRGGRQALEADRNLRDATLYRLQTLSESAERLSDDLKRRHPGVPWAEIGGFRNRLAHGYLDVDLGRTWEVIAHGLDPLARAAQLELARLRTLDHTHERDTGLNLG